MILRDYVCDKVNHVNAPSSANSLEPLAVPAQRVVARLRVLPPPLAEDRIGIRGILADAGQLLRAAPLPGHESPRKGKQRLGPPAVEPQRTQGLGDHLLICRRQTRRIRVGGEQP